MPAVVHPHKSLEALLSRLVPGLTEARRRPISGWLPRPIPIVVPAGQFADWLEVRLARLQGVCMGLEFIKPQEFVARISALAPEGAQSRLDPWSRDSLLWYILPHISSVAGQLGLPTGAGLSPREAFATANLLADHFDHYGHSRPELITAWLKNRKAPMSPKAKGSFAEESEAWQRRLWRQVEADIQASAHARPHPGHSLLKNAELLGQRGAEAYPDLFVLGTGGLEPLLVQTLVQLSASGANIEVHVVLPTLEYLGDLRPGTQRTLLLEDPEALPAAPGHPLVLSLGRQAIGSFLLLGELDENYTHWPEATDFSNNIESPVSGDCLLAQLQTDIHSNGGAAAAAALSDTDSGTGNRAPAKLCIDPTDTSLRVHACHGPRRELEVLRDELLRAFSELDNLKPEEVVIMCADLDTYAPLVSSVLGVGSPPLPVRVTEQAARAANPLLDALCCLLAHSQTRHNASALIGLLNLRAVQGALGVAEEPRALERIQSWIRQSGLTRDFDAAARAELDLPADDIGTWRFARDRLVSGMLFGPDSPARDALGTYVLPIAGTLESDTELRERFIQWFLSLEEMLREWQEPATAAQWGERLERANDALLKPDEKDNATAEFLRLLGFLEEIGSPAVLDAGAMEDWLSGQLQRQAASRTQVTGDICFGRFKQLNHLPCRVLALVGMQDGKFPRASRTPAWDLLQLEPRRWDRNPRVEDRQLFLDALQTPSERLIITASSLNLRTGKHEPFSSCVDELLRVVEDRFCLPVLEGKTPSLREYLVVHHRLQPFADAYFAEPTEPSEKPLPPSFNVRALDVARSLHADVNTKIAEKPFVTLAEDIEHSTEDVLRLSLDQLLDFWRDPARAWVRAQGITLQRDEPDDELLDRDPLQLDSLQTWQVRSSILRDCLSAKFPAEHTHALLTADRALPSADLGRGIWHKHFPRSKDLADCVNRLSVPGGLPVHYRLQYAGQQIELTGHLPLARVDGRECLLLYRIGNYNKPAYACAAWISMVVGTCARGEPLESVLIDDNSPSPLGDGPPPLAGIPLEDAMTSLVHLVAGYLQGQGHPLCFAPELSDAYATAVAKSGQQPDEALLTDVADASWYQDTDYAQGEGLSRAARLAWRGRDPFEAGQLLEWHAWSQRISAQVAQWKAKP